MSVCCVCTESRDSRGHPDSHSASQARRSVEKPPERGGWFSGLCSFTVVSEGFLVFFLNRKMLLD